MKPFLVDVPVSINIWIRPDCQRKQFEIIRKARPSILFIQSDGGRNEKEWKAIYANRKLVDDGIDWDCKIYRLYEERNLGLYTMGLKLLDFVWSKVDRCIFLEDDLLPSVSYFKFCAELLEKYKNDERIECICGVNLLGCSERCSSDYFFSRYGSIWGIATWKRNRRDVGLFDYAVDDYISSLLKMETKNDTYKWKRIKAYSKHEVYQGHVPGMEFWIDFHVSAQHRLQIIPKYNMISNIGCDVSASHATSLRLLPHGIRRAFNMKVYEIGFPINHPDYVIPDAVYENKRNRILAYNRPLLATFRKFEGVLLVIKYNGINGAFKKVQESFKRTICRIGNKKIES